MDEDLIHLLVLEPSTIVETLRRRFLNKQPYTMCGAVCLSVNPQQPLAHLYTHALKLQYASTEAESAHPYILANRALKGVAASQSSQTLVITGESGAGKTKMSELCLDFACDNTNDTGTRERLERILTTGQILEYVGNAQTTRNGNSSRFGKFLRVFYRDGVQVGAAIQTYLLERGRIALSSQTEGTFRIVYAVLDEFCKHYALDVLDRAVLGRREAAVPSTWGSFKEACEQIGLAPERARIEIADPIVAILLLLTRDYASASEYLGVETAALTQVIHNRRTTVNGETLWSECNVDDSRHRCRGLAMGLFQRLFARVVRNLNKFVGGDQDAMVTLNVLDIFGFESLDKNGLEQLCINYCNERIQALFIADAIVARREEYQREGVVVAPPLPDACLPDISSTCESGLFAMLDEAQRIPNSTAVEFVDAVDARSFPGVRVPMVRGRKGGVVFTVDHYADSIEYTADTFMDRNTDQLRAEILDTLRESSRVDIVSLFESPAPPSTRNRMWSKSVTRTFSLQMAELVDTIRTTTTHYIRCIRPNKSTTPNSFDDEYVQAQIHSNGVIQAAHVMREGFTHRMTHAEFLHAFRKTGRREKKRKDGLHWGTTRVYMTAARYAVTLQNKAACAIQRAYARYDPKRRRLIRACSKVINAKRLERLGQPGKHTVVETTDNQRHAAVCVIQRRVKAHNAHIFDRWKKLDDIERLRAHVSVLRAQIRLKDEWIFQAQQKMRMLLHSS